MNLLHVISSMNPATGGPCQGIRNSNQSLSNLGVHREVVCLDDPSASFLGHDPFPNHAVGPGKGTWHYSQKLIPWLLENFHRFDVIIVNGLWQYHGYAVRKALDLYKKERSVNGASNKIVPKLFIMPHGMLDPYFQRAKSRKLKSIRNWFYWKLIEKKVVNEADGILFTCEEELRLARQTFREYNPKRELNVGYGIEAPPAFSELMKSEFLKKLPYLKDKRFLLFLSRVNEKKGVDLLITAYINFANANPGLQLPKLVIAGPNSETKYGKEMQLLAFDLKKNSDNIFFTGMLSGNVKWGAIYGCEAFILPSHQENFGIAVAEALACSKPVLISDQVNIWREIEFAQGGIIKKDSLDGTADLLETWLTLSADEKRLMGQNAFRCFDESFKVKLAAEKFYHAISS